MRTHNAEKMTSQKYTLDGQRESTCSGRKPIPTLKREAVEAFKSVKTAITRKKKTSNPAKANKASASKKGKRKAVPPLEDSDIKINVFTCY